MAAGALLPAFSLVNSRSLPFSWPLGGGWGRGREGAGRGPGYDLQGLLTSILRRTTVWPVNNRHLVCQAAILFVKPQAKHI